MEKVTYKYEKFRASLGALERSINVFFREDIPDDIRENLVASVVKHFEICYEVAWKFLKIYLEKRYAQIVDSPKKVFRECFVLGLIDEALTKEFLDISEARNSTTHDYDEENAYDICKRINSYYAALKKIETIYNP